MSFVPLKASFCTLLVQELKAVTCLILLWHRSKYAPGEDGHLAMMSCPAAAGALDAQEDSIALSLGSCTRSHAPLSGWDISLGP